MESVVRSIYAAHLNTCKLMNRPLTVLPNSTLNQKFNLFPNELPAANEFPTLAYLGIGNKGASYDLTADNFILTDPIPHLPRHASLYNFIPFVVVPAANDLAATDRIKYRLRVPMTINSVDYIAYYLRVLDISALIPDVELRNVNNGVITSSAFTPSLSDLSPTPPVISTTDLNSPNGDYLVSSAKVSFVLDQADIQAIMDACTLLYGDARYAVINEIALCTGIDRILNGTFGGATAPYTEAVYSQIATFISQYHALTSNTTSVSLELDIGSVEPLLA